MRPAFLITIDTEGDNLWSRPKTITTDNARWLPRFQLLCERYQLKPTWLTNHEMACCEVFQEFGSDVLKRGAGEIGMHLHAWNSPPISPLTDDDFRYQPFLTEYPLSVMREKIVVLTDKLESVFGVKMTGHRAGRWAFNKDYARMLVQQGYSVDCSVTPHVSWRTACGAPQGNGGVDFTNYPEDPYYLEFTAAQQEWETQRLLEAPMTIRPVRNSRWRSTARRMLSRCGSLPARVARRVFPSVSWLRPNGRNLQEMKHLVAACVQEQRPCIEFMLHSSEFMPAGSPRFRTLSAIERLYDHLEELFSLVGERCRGMTLSEFEAQTTSCV